MAKSLARPSKTSPNKAARAGTDKAQARKADVALLARIAGALEQIRHKAETVGLTLVEREEGFDFAPQRDGLTLSEDEYRQMPKADRERLSERTRELRTELDRTMQSLNGTREKTLEKLRALDRELGEAEVRRLMQPLARAYQGNQVGSQTAKRGRQREPDHSNDEDAPAAEAIPQRAPEENQGGEGQRVGVDEPLDCHDRRREISFNRRQRDVDDGFVNVSDAGRQDCCNQYPRLGAGRARYCRRR